MSTDPNTDTDRTDASGGWRDEYEHAGVSPDVEPQECEEDGCIEPAKPRRVRAPNVLGERVLCDAHAEEFLGVKL